MKFKVQSSKFKIVGALSLCCTAALLFCCSSSSAELTIKANHDHIKIDFFYNGTTVSVGGVSDPGVDLVVKIASAEGRQTLRKKGKLGGLLWMNVGNLSFEHVPNLYFIHSTKRLDEILTPEEMDKYLIGYQSLERHTEISPLSDEKEKDRWFNEFIRFKEFTRLYSTSYGRISLSEGDKKQQAYHILLDWPYQAQPGSYTVTVYGIRDKKVIEKAESIMVVEQVGFVKALSTMAKNNGSLYGVLSIAIALVAGFGVGIIFRKGGGLH